MILAEESCRSADLHIRRLLGVPRIGWWRFLIGTGCLPLHLGLAGAKNLIGLGDIVEH